MNADTNEALPQQIHFTECEAGASGFCRRGSGDRVMVAAADDDHQMVADSKTTRMATRRGRTGPKSKSRSKPTARFDLSDAVAFALLAVGFIVSAVLVGLHRGWPSLDPDSPAYLLTYMAELGFVAGVIPAIFYVVVDALQSRSRRRRRSNDPSNLN